jgi:hypothetical protein
MVEPSPFRHCQESIQRDLGNLRRSKGLPDKHTGDEDAGTSHSNFVNHPGVMWPIFLFGLGPQTPLPRLAVAQLEAQDKPLYRLGHDINISFVAVGTKLIFELHCIIRG